MLLTTAEVKDGKALAISQHWKMDLSTSSYQKNTIHPKKCTLGYKLILILY